MHISRSVRRGFVVAAAASGLLALPAGSASANGSPAGALATATATATSADAATATSTAPSTATPTSFVTDVTHGVRHTPGDTGSTAKRGEKTGDGARDAGKAVRHVTQEAGAAVSEAPSAPTHQDLGALPGLPAQAAPSSAPGLPEDLVIEVPQIVPGVPSIGIIPLSLPELPVTPSIPAL